MRPRAPSALLVFALVAGGCAPSEDEIQADFDAHVADSNACEVDADCAIIWPGCPLGCFVAVRADAVEECRAVARDLVSSYEALGRRCYYDCPQPSEPYCGADGRCQVDVVSP